MRKSIITVLGPTDPVYDLTTVEAVNAALGITGNTADDATTAAQITAASRIIADLCNRTFALLDVTESFRVKWGEPVHTLYLRQYPVQDVVSIMQADSEADATMYEMDDEAGLLWMKCGRWCGEVIATYSGGYDLPSEAPPLLAQACIEVIRAQNFNAGRDPGLRTVQHGDTSVTFSDYYQRFGLAGAGTSVLPPNAAGMIDRYRAAGMNFWKADPIWQGQVAYIIGGGPSLLTQDLTQLQGQNVIVINSSWRAFPDAQFLIFSDMRWWCDYLKRAGGFKGAIICTSSAASGPLVHMKRKSSQGLATDRDMLMIKNTTLTAAINLAVHLGVAKIVLLGIDQKTTDGKHWHHAAHPWHPTADCFKRQQVDMPKIAEDLKRLGIECVNASPGSALTLWPVVDLADHVPRQQEMRQIA